MFIIISYDLPNTVEKSYQMMLKRILNSYI